MKNRHPTTYDHPRPWQDLLVQNAALAFLILTLALLGFQIWLLTQGANPLLMLAISLTAALLILPTLMVMAATPPIEMTDGGLRIKPRFLPGTHVLWSDVRAVKPYPLLPEPNAETVRRMTLGRMRYKPAAGVMLLIPSLPWYFRFTAIFAGEGFTPLIALTNRTHTDYDNLIAEVRAHTSEVWQ